MMFPCHIFLNSVIPRCSCSRRSSRRQETARTSSSLWRSAGSKTKTIKHFYPPILSLILIFENVNSHDALTPTTLFMASSLSDSLLLSNISLRSSFLRTENIRGGAVSDQFPGVQAWPKVLWKICVDNICVRVHVTVLHTVRSIEVKQSSDQTARMLFTPTKQQHRTNFLPSHDVTMLIPWIMLTHVGHCTHNYTPQVVCSTQTEAEHSER